MPKTKPTKAKAEVSSTTNYTKLLARRFSREVMLGALFAEMIGTFILTAVVLNTSGNILIAGLTVIIMSMALSKLSGGHINPAVTIALYATRNITGLRAACYLLAQALGGMVALVVVTQFVQSAAPLSSDMLAAGAAPQKVFSLAPLVGDWRPFLAELLGATVFGVGVAAAVIGKKQGIEAGFVIGGSLLLGLILASQGSGAVLNPAVALGLNAYQDANGLWSALTYAVAPLLGVTAGAWLYKLLQWDVDNSSKTA